MSVKFKSETLQTASDKVQNVLSSAEQGNILGARGKHPIAESIGTALTGGMKSAGTPGYLAVRLQPTNPWQ